METQFGTDTRIRVEWSKRCVDLSSPITAALLRTGSDAADISGTLQTNVGDTRRAEKTQQWDN